MLKFKSSQTRGNANKKGFTLLELLIVIAILAILGTVLVLVLNPAETLKKSRDVQRISDLSTLKTAIGLYVTSTTSPVLDASANNTCDNGTGTPTIYFSYPSDSPGAAITDATLDGGSGSNPAVGQVTNANLTTTAGSGWVKVNFSGLTGGSPISNLPTDPTNTISSVSAVASTDLVYRYQCDKTDITYEIDATLESTYYTSTDNKMTKDGGNNSAYYEVGTKLSILGTGTDF